MAGVVRSASTLAPAGAFVRAGAGHGGLVRGIGSLRQRPRDAAAAVAGVITDTLRAATARTRRPID
ncbi:hypothetical protein ACWEWX_35005 [Streptomyces asiaticus]